MLFRDLLVCYQVLLQSSLAMCCFVSFGFDVLDLLLVILVLWGILLLPLSMIWNLVTF
jgi:hypothetical protein